MQIFNFFGSLLGYLLWFFYKIINNYGVAIILFTIATKIIVFPFSVKQQKSMAATSKLALKQKELQKKYANDKQKLQLETQKLYEKEGVSPAGGCLTMFVPMIIMLGLYYTVLYPLANAVHASGTAVSQATDMITKIPGVSSMIDTKYAQIEVIKYFHGLNANHLLTMFSGAELSRIELFSHGFKFLGLDLLNTPCNGSNIFGTLFSSNLWIIPIACLVSSLVTQYFTMKMQPGMQQQQGCMKYMMYFFPLLTAYWACIMPAAVGFYWFISTIVAFLQMLAMNKWYNPVDLNAVSEARHVALLEANEAKLKPSVYRNKNVKGVQPKQGSSKKKK